MHKKVTIVFPLFFSDFDAWLGNIYNLHLRKFKKLFVVVNSISLREKHFDVHFRRIRSVFLLKDGKDPSFEKGNG